jgi:hypothetical protein
MKASCPATDLLAMSAGLGVGELDRLEFLPWH